MTPRETAARETEMLLAAVRGRFPDDPTRQLALLAVTLVNRAPHAQNTDAREVKIPWEYIHAIRDLKQGLR